MARVQALSISSPEVNQAHERSGAEQELLPDLHRVTCPVLVLGGQDDPLSPPSTLVELPDALTATRCELVLVPGARHTLFVDQPELAYAAVRDFLASL